MRTARLLVAVGAPLLCAVAAHAQQGGAAAPAAPPAPNPRAGLSVLLDGSDLLVQRRRFEAGNRTYWHTHEKGFLILVEKGRARVQKRGEPMKELAPGDVDYTPPGVLHWHGAAPNETFIQIGTSFGGAINFTDPVTDAQYEGR